VVRRPAAPREPLSGLAAPGEVTSATHLAIASVYALLYCGCVLSLASAAFESRDFK